LRQAVEVLQTGDWQQLKEGIHALSAAYPDLALGHRLLAEVHRHLGETDSAATALKRYRPENQRAARVANEGTLRYIPVHTALSFTYLGLIELALQVLREGVENHPGYTLLDAEQMAQSYLEVAREFSRAGELVQMEEVVELSVRIFSTKEACNILALRAMGRGEAAQALQRWEQSLALDAEQAEIHRRAGMVALIELGQRDKALYHLSRAIQLDPALQRGIATELAAARDHL